MPPSAAPPDYRTFLASRHHAGGDGFDPVFLPDKLFPFQRHLVEWAVRRGRAALFEDCGLGKSFQELAFAENVVRRTNRPVLLLCPLAVARTMLGEAEKLGVDAVRSSDGRFPPGARVVVANYERLHLFDPAAFAGAVGDESSVLKNADGKTTAAVTEFFRTLRYRLLASATAAPNDHVEIGTHSEALGELGRMDMLARFFTNKDNTLHPRRTRMGGGHVAEKWRFRGHAERLFWRWVATWGRAVRRPSDLGFDDGAYTLPPLEVREHTVPAAVRPGHLFPVPAVTLAEQRAEAKATLRARCEKVAELVAGAEPAVCWGHLNPECDLIERLVPGAEQVSGATPDERKEELYQAFEAGQLRVLVTKPEIAGFGLNWQHCGHQTFFPSHSFERYYQAVRRSWRFGRAGRVRVDLVASEAEAGVGASLARKQARADRMFAELVACMADALAAARTESGTLPPEVPAWLS